MRLFAVFAVISLLFAACSKEEASPTSSNSSGFNLTFKLQGSTVSGNATWRELPNNRWRIYWEESGTGSYKNIEIDLYGNSPGTYTVSSSPSSAGQAGFQYYVQAGGSTTNYVGQSGTVTLSSFSNDRMSGTFSLTAQAGGTLHPVTEGKFENVPKQ
jgi:hypothetical protein